jgi:hypothetical protein
MATQDCETKRLMYPVKKFGLKYSYLNKILISNVIFATVAAHTSIVDFK